MWAKLCRLCERPAADGGYRAAELDLNNFSEWCLNFLGTNLAEEVQADDLICYFCVWDARLLFENEKNAQRGILDKMRWWPEEGASKEFSLRNYYKAEYIKQCWVPLMKVPEISYVSSSDKSLDETNIEKPVKRKIGRKYAVTSKSVQCVYCKKHCHFCHISKHIRIMHADIAIRCDYLQCSKYFLSEEEKCKHIQEYHLKPKEQVLHDCCYCSRQDLTRKTLYKHVRWCHSEIAIKCRVGRCGDFFKTKADLEVHMNTKHRGLEESKKHKCSICDCKFERKIGLANHEAKKHKISKHIFNCPMCPAILISKSSLSFHIKIKHKFRTCPACNLQISAFSYCIHFVKVSCRKCERTFDCSELLKKHKKECRGLLFKCDFCPNVYFKKYELRYHINSHLGHIAKGLQLKERKIRCKTCSKYFSSKLLLKKHTKRMHHKTARHKFSCAHCQKLYLCKSRFQKHLAQIHNLITFSYRCKLCSRKLILKSQYEEHIKYCKMENSKMVEWTVCKKIVQNYNLQTHMIRIHAIPDFPNK